MSADAMTPLEITAVPLDEFERRARALNAASESGPRIYLDDRDLVVELAGLAGWCEVLAMRIDNAEWCASRTR